MTILRMRNKAAILDVAQIRGNCKENQSLHWRHLDGMVVALNNAQYNE